MPSTVIGLSAGMFNVVGKPSGIVILYGVAGVGFTTVTSLLVFFLHPINTIINKKIL